MARIAFLHNALGKTDGVSLEVDKWRVVLERMGHAVVYCAGNDDVPGGYGIPELSFNHPLTNKLLRNATVAFTDYASEDDLVREIEEQADILSEKLRQFIRDERVEMLIPNNLLSVGYHVPALLALPRVIHETGLPTIVHNHDFYFEDSGEVHPTCGAVWRIMEANAPPTGPNIQNVVINRLAQQALNTRKGIDATVAPNVFDFAQPRWQADAYNADFRNTFGIGVNDLVFLQATRILDRKGVELAIDVVAELNTPAGRAALAANALYDGRRFSAEDRIILLCAGYVETFGISGDYYDNLRRKAKRLGVDLRFIGNRIKHSRGMEDGQKVYSLWDSYVHADFVTYPSTWEGWGNQLIEAIFARLPVVLFEYPVYSSDLAPVGFEMVTLGHTLGPKDTDGLVTIPPAQIALAAQRIITLLHDHHARSAMVEHNFALAQEHFSFVALEAIIGDLLQQSGMPNGTEE